MEVQPLRHATVKSSAAAVLMSPLTQLVASLGVQAPEDLYVWLNDQTWCCLNQNLGGTGGFARGMLSLIDGGTHIHALFMDDDASCETESIARALALLFHGRMPRLAVTGSLISESRPWQLLENGARFDGYVQPIGIGRNLHQVLALLDCGRGDPRPNYGAWWFFAFGRADVQRGPFPFFVRGDDIFFGLHNDFEVITTLGIACQGEDFHVKAGRRRPTWLRSTTWCGPCCCSAAVRAQAGARAVHQGAQGLPVRQRAGGHAGAAGLPAAALAAEH